MICLSCPYPLSIEWRVEFSTYTEFRFTQQPKHPPIEVTTGNDAVVRLEHHPNAYEPIEVTFGNDIVVRLKQFLNIPEPIEAILGNDTVISLEQF